MPLIGFQKQFVALVESGEKRQTIRAYRKDGREPKSGERLYLYTGLRTKQCRKLGEAVCLNARRFEITGEASGIFWLIEDDGGDMEVMTTDECHDLASADGFATHYEMTDWFKKTHGLPFEGVLIRWGEIENPSVVEGQR